MNLSNTTGLPKNEQPAQGAGQNLERKRILLVEDDQDIIALMRRIFDGLYDLVCAEDGEAGIRLASREAPDVILLDLGIPKLDGMKVCEALRSGESTRHIPVIMVTGANCADQRVAAFSKGVDDYISKPFGPAELLARIQSKLRRVDESRGITDVIHCGNLQLRPKSYEASVEGELIELSLLEFNLLKYFVENPNRVVSRDEILRNVWNGVRVGSRTVDTHILWLRKKLKAFNQSFQTVYGAGYMLRVQAQKPRSDA